MIRIHFSFVKVMYRNLPLSKNKNNKKIVSPHLDFEQFWVVPHYEKGLCEVHLNTRKDSTNLEDGEVVKNSIYFEKKMQTLMTTKLLHSFQVSKCSLEINASK